MADFIVLRLTPAQPTDPTTFGNLLNGLTVKIYEISSATPDAGLPGDATPAIATATYNAPQSAMPVPVGTPPLTYPAGTTIAQHYTPNITFNINTLNLEISSVSFVSVATAVFPYAGGGPEYVAPDLRVEIDPAGSQPLHMPSVYYDVQFYSGPVLDPSAYQDILPGNVSAYVPLPPALKPGVAHSQLPADGSPPNYDDLFNAVTTVLAKDPGGVPGLSDVAALASSVDKCRNVACEIVYGAQEALPAPTEPLGAMYSQPPNDGSSSNSNEQSRQDFQGRLSSYYATRNATAERLTGFVHSLACAAACEIKTQAATSAIVTFPVNPNPASPPKLATVAQAEVIFNGALGIDVPAPYFYVLTAQLPVQITADQRYKIATGAGQQQNLTVLTQAVDSGEIVLPPNMNPAQAVRILDALAVPTGSSTVQYTVVAPLWPDWMGYPATANWRAYQPGDDLTKFWPGLTGEEATHQGAFLDLVLFAITQGYVDSGTNNPLAVEIKNNLRVTPVVGTPPIAKVADLAQALASDWQAFFAPAPLNQIIVSRLPDFTLPGTADARVAAFISYVRKFFDVAPAVPLIAGGTAGLPDLIQRPTSDLIQQVMGALAFPLTAAQLAGIPAAAQALIPNDADARAWLVATIGAMNELSILAQGTPAGLQFSVMEALYARGFISTKSVLELPQADFQQALIGTVAYDFAAAIYANAGVPGNFTVPPAGPFAPINPGALVDCVPPPYLSPLGPVAYLNEMLQVSEQATCDAPLAPPVAGKSTLGAVLAARRGPLGSLAVSPANLETALPMIDLVNECLEFMAATTPPTAHGTVYDTSGDALAGHALCPDDDCCSTKGCVEPPRERKDDDAEEPAKPACHDPDVLFAALPEYSTPATPVKADAAVLPAVYNKLKYDFAACCLPYSQAIDVSRTYLGRFKSCRFEEMRTFRKCITEFALDPAGEPADFQSHLWRYPVRIDIAIEYLGITPEEYAFLFNGAPPKPCAPREKREDDRGLAIPPRPWTLYGLASERDHEIPWTRAVSSLPVSLSKLCLSYCEFIELWKTGFIPFGNAGDREGHRFPDCEPCCLDGLALEFPGENGAAVGLYKIAVFVRLWRKLQHVCGARYTFAQLRDICEVFELFSGNTVNPDFIRQFAAFQILRDRFGLPLANPRAKPPANATGAARTQILSLWAAAPNPADRAWALDRLIHGVRGYAKCHHRECTRLPEFEKLLASNLDRLSRLAGFDPSVPANAWAALPTHTLRFAEVLAKIWASNFSIGELMFLFTADDHLGGDDPFALQSPNEASGDPLELPDDERRHSLWRLRRALLDAAVSDEDVHHWTWSRIQTALRDEFGYGAAEVTAFGEHFFPGVLEESGHPVSSANRRFTTALNAADTVPMMWNAPPYGPFRYDDALNELWTQLPLEDDEAIEQFTRVRRLQPAEQAAAQELYFQPRAMLARFAFLFADFAGAVRHLVEGKNANDRWHYFRRQFALAHRRCHIIARHLAEHVEAATGQECPEGAREGFAVLRSLYGDENGSNPPPDWEDDAGHMPPLKWAPAPNGSAFAAILGLTGTGLLTEYTPQGSGAVIWREPSSGIAGFGHARDRRNCPVPTVLPALGLAATADQMRFVSFHNGLAMKDATGEWLGGAGGFSVQWSGALIIEKEGGYTFKIGPMWHEPPNIENEEPRRTRWQVTLRRGQRPPWIVASHNWAGAPHHGGAEPLHLHRGAYELLVEFVEPNPRFEDDDDLFPLHTGLRLHYAGPDTDGEMTDVPHERLIMVSKDDPLGQGLAGLSPSATAYLAQLYVGSLRDIRRTYQRAFKALLFVHRFALSAHPRAGGDSELGYMLAHGDLFAGRSYYPAAAGVYGTHHADFNFNLLPLDDNFHKPINDARTTPQLKRIQALFDWWERIFDYDCVRAEVRERCERHLWLLFDEAADKQPAQPRFLLRHMGADARHWDLDLRYFQGQFAPVYAVTAVDLEDDRWTVRAWHADRWLRSLECCFTPMDITKARPDLWASLKPATPTCRNSCAMGSSKTARRAATRSSRSSTTGCASAAAMPCWPTCAARPGSRRTRSKSAIFSCSMSKPASARRQAASTRRSAPRSCSSGEAAWVWSRHGP
jgi:hypothetical protein